MYPQRTQEMEKCKHTPKYIIQLMNTLHGLKQAGGAWQKRVRAILEKHGLVLLISDDYINHETGDVIASHVNNFPLVSPDKERLQTLAEAIHYLRHQ